MFMTREQRVAALRLVGAGALAFQLLASATSALADGEDRASDDDNPDSSVRILSAQLDESRARVVGEHAARPIAPAGVPPGPTIEAFQEEGTMYFLPVLDEDASTRKARELSPAPVVPAVEAFQNEGGATYFLPTR